MHLERQQEELSADGWSTLILGDLNAHMEGERVGEEGALPNLAGTCLEEWVGRQSLHIINNTSRCYGRWTREEGGKKSIPDYVIGCEGLLERLSKMEIDDKGQLVSNSDHNWIVCDIDVAALVSERKEPRQVWNLRGEPDWDKFRELIVEKSRAFMDKEWEGDGEHSQGEVMTSEFNKILVECGREAVRMKWVGGNRQTRDQTDPVAEDKIKRRKEACKAFNRAKRLKEAKVGIDMTKETKAEYDE